MDRFEQIQRMLADDPSDPFLRYALALEYAARGQRDRAIADTEQLIADRPDYLGAYYQLGQWLEQSGANEKAVAVYRKGIELANAQGNKKTLGELTEALWMLED